MKNFEWKLACSNCGFEFEILFDERAAEEEKSILRRCPCGCEMTIEEEKSWESEETEE